MSGEPVDSLALQKLELERDKLRYERQDVIFRYITILGTAIAFLWGTYRYFNDLAVERTKERQTAAAANSVQKIAASKPFLDKQLKLFEEVTQITAFLATVPESPDREEKILRFKQLYWGEMALVEQGPVESAMVKFKQGLENNASISDMQQLSLQIAHACREELAQSWDVSHWKLR